MTTALQFVDCSSNNPLPNVRAYAAAGHRHLCRKVSEGVGYHWFEGDALADHAHQAGLHVGHYHWLRPDASATAQAAFFVTSVKSHLHEGDWLMTDFERTPGVADPADISRAAQLHEFNAYVRQHLPGYPLYVYTGNWYLDGKPHSQAECRRWPVVMSDYSGAAHMPNPYQLNYVAWQFTDRAKVAGFSSPVDYNRWLISPKPAPTHPDWSDMATQAEIQKMIDASIERHLRAAVFGGNAVLHKETPGLYPVAGEGLTDRLKALEARKP